MLIFGDHGMTADGNHGGATADETQSALLVYSTAPLGVRVVSAHDDDVDDTSDSDSESESEVADGKDSESGAREEEAARARHAGGSAEVAADNGNAGAAHRPGGEQSSASDTETPVREGRKSGTGISDSVDGGDGSGDGGEWLVSERALNAYASVPIADGPWFQRQIAAARRTADAAARRSNRMPPPSAASSADADADADAVAAASALSVNINTSSSSSPSSSSSFSSSYSLPARDVAADIRAAHAKAARNRALFERDERLRVRMVDQV